MPRYFDITVPYEHVEEGKTKKWKKIGYIREDDRGNLTLRIYPDCWDKIREYLSDSDGYAKIFAQRND